MGLCRVRLGKIGLRAKLVIHGLLKFDRRPHSEPLVGLDKNHPALGPDQAQEQRGFARMRRRQLPHLFQMLRRQVGRMQPQVDLLGVARRRVGQPEDIPGAVCFLASDDAAFITGQTISVSGFHLMRH